MPYQFAVLIDRFDTMQRYAVSGPIRVYELEKEMIFRSNADFIERQANELVFNTIVVGDLKMTFSKPGIPPDLVKQFANGFHDFIIRGQDTMNQGESSLS
jgi:hypothetical protein